MIVPLIAATLLAGCRGDGTVPTVPLTGTVTLAGAPLASGFVVFHPEVEGAPPVAATVTQGRFEIPAIPPGKYKVAVRSKALDKPSEGQVSSGSAAPAERAPPDPIPLRYREPSIPVEVTQTNDPIRIELSNK